MGVIYVHDRTQSQGTPLPKCSHNLVDRLFVQFVPLDAGPYGQPDGTPKTDRFTDDLGKIGTEGIAQIFGKRIELRVNEANVSSGWKSARIVAQDIEHDAVDVPLERAGNSTPPPPSPITGNGTCDEWRAAVFAIFAKHGFTTVGPDNEGQGANQAPHLRATIAEIKALHPSPFVQWQYESTGNPPELRPRLFLPHNGSDQFERYADLGDWNGPLKWDHCH